MWTIARYLPTSLFSLRPALSTASGAHTLLVPTPYAIKMALLDVALRLYGVGIGAEFWPIIRDLDVALDLPDALVVNKTFIKIQRPTRLKKSDAADVAAAKAEGRYPFNPTIAFREFVQYGGDMGVAVQPRQSTDQLPLADLLRHVNYLGKRGSFWQLQALPDQHDELGAGWTLITHAQASFTSAGTLQVLDDAGPKLTWEHVNIYSAKAIKISPDQRVLRSIVLPYTLQRSSYRYSLYHRITEAPS